MFGGQWDHIQSGGELMIIRAEAIKMADSIRDNVNTDVIIAGKYTKTLNKEDLAKHVLEDLDPALGKQLPGRLLVAGTNFGSGSSREQAPIALKSAGCQGVIASSFARIFFRNAINIGLPLIETDIDEVADGDLLCVDLSSGQLRNETRGQSIAITPLPEIMMNIFISGGLVPYLREKGSFQ